MRKTSRLTSLILAAALGLIPAIASAQPMWRPPGGGPGPGMHRPGPGGPGPGLRPGHHRPPRPHHGGGGYDPGAAAAAGIIGLAVGAIAAGAAADAQRNADSHVRRCLRAYRSYDPDTDTYIDKRGRERRCRL